MAGLIEQVEFLTSQNGGQQVLNAGYRYRLNVRRQVATHWKCVQTGCKGRCSTIGDYIRGVTDHCHPPEAQEELRLLSRLRNRVQNEVSPVQQLYEDEVGTMDPVVAAVMPNFHSIKSSLYHHRRKTRPVLPQVRQEVNLEGAWTTTTDGLAFLCVDDGEEDKILIFATDEMLNIMQEAETLFMDGTFYVCPRLWYQLYSIHCMVDKVMFPVAYALLPNKTRETYVRLFTLLNTAVQTRTGTEPSPRFIQTDFEAAAIKATQDVYPDADIRGCFFHYCQAVLRNVAEKGLAVEYKTNPEIQRHVRRAAALLPLDQVRDVWVDVMEEGPQIPRVLQFNDYMTETWVDFDARFSTFLWNQHANIGPRTNNHLEGFHSKLKNRMRKAHPTVFEFITHIKIVESTNRAKRAQLNLGAAPPPRRRIYTDIDNRLQRLMQHLRTGRKTPLQFLDAAGHPLKMD